MAWCRYDEVVATRRVSDRQKRWLCGESCVLWPWYVKAGPVYAKTFQGCVQSHVSVSITLHSHIYASLHASYCCKLIDGRASRMRHPV